MEERIVMKKVQIPDIVMISMDKIKPNDYNPNKMTPEVFNELVSDIEDFGFVQPIIVAPIESSEDGYEYEIIDGEHRYEGLSVLGVKEIPVYIKTGLTSDQRKFQTVRKNRIRGSFDRKQFTALVKDLMKRHPLADIAKQMVFSNPSELEAMIDNSRNSLPTPEMQQAFDKVKSEIKTVDDLSNVLNQLFTKYGSTLPGNFMVLDFGGKEHIWVQVKNKSNFKKIKELAHDVMSSGFTFDSFIGVLLTNVEIDKVIKRLGEKLDKVQESDSIEL